MWPVIWIAPLWATHCDAFSSPVSCSERRRRVLFRRRVRVLRLIVVDRELTLRPLQLDRDFHLGLLDVVVFPKRLKSLRQHLHPQRPEGSPSKFVFPSTSVFNSIPPRLCLPFGFTGCMITAALRTGFPLSSFTTVKYSQAVGLRPYPFAQKPFPPAQASPARPHNKDLLHASHFMHPAFPVTYVPSAASPSLFYNAGVKTWDVIIIGGGIIGLSLAIALRKRGAYRFGRRARRTRPRSLLRRRRNAGRLPPGNTPSPAATGHSKRPPLSGIRSRTGSRGRHEGRPAGLRHHSVPLTSIFDTPS